MEINHYQSFSIIFDTHTLVEFFSNLNETSKIHISLEPAYPILSCILNGNVMFVCVFNKLLALNLNSFKADIIPFKKLSESVSNWSQILVVELLKQIISSIDVF